MEYIWPVLGLGTAIFVALCVGWIVTTAASEKNPG
jgi:hypothetical protein